MTKSDGGEWRVRLWRLDRDAEGITWRAVVTEIVEGEPFQRHTLERASRGDAMAAAFKWIGVTMHREVLT